MDRGLVAADFGHYRVTVFHPVLSWHSAAPPQSPTASGGCRCRSHRSRRSTRALHANAGYGASPRGRSSKVRPQAFPGRSFVLSGNVPLESMGVNFSYSPAAAPCWWRPESLYWVPRHVAGLEQLRAGGDAKLARTARAVQMSQHIAIRKARTATGSGRSRVTSAKRFLPPWR